MEDVPTDDGKVVNKEANNENIKEYLSIVKGNLKGSVKKVEDSVENNYTVGLGETLVFPLDNERAIKLTASPKIQILKLTFLMEKLALEVYIKGNMYYQLM